MTAQAPLTLIVDLVGEGNGMVPRLCRLHCPNNTLSQIAAAGFLDNFLLTESISLLATDFVAAVASDGNKWYRPVFTAGSCQLTAI